MDIVPLGPGFAAELRGVTLADVAADDAAYAAVRAAFEEHSVLVFRGQDVSDEVQIAFSRRFGPLEVTKVGSRGVGTNLVILTTMDENGKVVPPDHRLRVAQQGQPALAHRQHVQGGAGARLGTVGADHPGRGRGDRIRLDPSRLCIGSTRHCASGSKIPSPGTTTPIRAARSRPASPPRTSARRCRRNAGGWCGRIRRTAAARSTSPRMPTASREWTQAAAQKLLDELTDAATAPGQSYVHTWRNGDVVMWDNRATMHRGRPWPAHEARLMVRTTISATDADGLQSVRPPARQAAGVARQVEL